MQLLLPFCKQTSCGMSRAWPGDGPEVMVGVMDPSVSGSALAALGEDLFLLSIWRQPDGPGSLRAGSSPGTRPPPATRNWTRRWSAWPVPPSRRGRKRGWASPGAGSAQPMPPG
jgi:hypothetical protein